MNKKKNYSTYLLLAPFLAIAMWVCYFTIFMEGSTEVRLPISGYDPRNLLSGHYVAYRIDWDKADCSQADWKGTCPIRTFKTSGRFYVPENSARAIERAINRSDVRTEIVFSYRKGKTAIARDLLIDGESFRTFE